MMILAIETSCDETAVAILQADRIKGKDHFAILANVVSSQVKLHAKYGGVVPNLAAREHTKNITPCLEKALKQAQISDFKKLDFFGVTAGPGLIPALLVGVSSAKTLAYSLDKPLIGVNHMEAHIYANWIENTNIKFPLLSLTVSGGHTQIILMKGHGKYEILGETQDDAVGEAFDKVARILGLPYPGGPAISKMAENGDPESIKFPRPMKYSKDFNFSFSGLKTAVLYEFRSKNQELRSKKEEKEKKRCCHPELTKSHPEETKDPDGNNSKIPLNPPFPKGEKISQAQNDSQLIANFCASFQQAAVDVLIHKTIKAAQKHNVKSVILAGGVSANKELRRQLQEAVDTNLPETTKLYVPKFEHCTDNAVMIAVATYFHIKNKRPITSWKDIKADSNLSL